MSLRQRAAAMTRRKSKFNLVRRVRRLEARDRWRGCLIIRGVREPERRAVPVLVMGEASTLLTI
jgi:hypothetical protein